VNWTWTFHLRRYKFVLHNRSKLGIARQWKYPCSYFTEFSELLISFWYFLFNLFQFYLILFSFFSWSKSSLFRKHFANVTTFFFILICLWLPVSYIRTVFSFLRKMIFWEGLCNVNACYYIIRYFICLYPCCLNLLEYTSRSKTGRRRVHILWLSLDYLDLVGNLLSFIFAFLTFWGKDVCHYQSIPIIIY